MIPAVFFRINALLLALMIVCFIAHEITGYLDLKIAMATRKVTIFEHQVHSALEILPLTALLLVMALHWPQTRALFGLGTQAPDFTLGSKQRPRWEEILPPAIAFLLLVVVPYAEELWRGATVKRPRPHPKSH